MDANFKNTTNCVNVDEVYDYLNNENLDDDFNDKSFNNISDQYVINACIEGRLDLIEEYLTSGHDVNEFLITGWTLLLYAASYVQPDVVQYLLNLGGDPNIHQEGYTPLMALCNSSGGTPEKRIICLKYLIEGKADVNAANKVKETALMYACKVQEINFILELLKYVAHFNFADSEQRTALFYAVTSNRYDVIKILIENGADITWTNYSGLCAYDVAVIKGFEELKPLLAIDYNKNEYDKVEIDSVNSWLDMFPTISKMNIDQVDSDILTLLNGMGLENYKSCFCGIDLKTFLRLREEDLESLGIDISIHRKRFINELVRFHRHEWNNNLMKLERSQPFTPFEAIKVLGNINKQLSVMSSSIYFSKNCLDSMEEDEELNMTNEERELLQNKIKNIQLIALRIKNATNRIKSLAEVIKEQNSDLSLPTYIEKKNKKNNHKWLIITAITVASIFFFRLKNIKKVWNNEKPLWKNWRNIFNFSLIDVLYDKFYSIGLFLQNDS